jgi:protein-serine/threonine kinase
VIFLWLLKVLGGLFYLSFYTVLADLNRVVPLIASFQDLNNLYLVMDYMPGGDFLGLLIRDNVLTEPVTKWYIAEMILCIEEAHALRWIHRDVKPDNFLISASGHLKISDFGLAFDGHWSHDQAYFNNHRYSLLTKLGINVEGDSIDKAEGRTVAAAMKFAHVIMGGKDRHERASSNSSDNSEGILNWRNKYGNRTRARSVVGTSQYMAPEVVRGELYDARCDWWSVAVILYEVSNVPELKFGHIPELCSGSLILTINSVYTATRPFWQKKEGGNRLR